MYYACHCGETIHPARHALGYITCLECGDTEARALRATRYTIVPMHKQGYMAFSGADAVAMVKQINPKRTT
jgi:hypothetical protein